MSAIFGLFGCGLLALVVIATGLRLQRFPVRARIAVMLAGAFAVFAPVGDLSAAAYVRGVTGDLSMTTLVLAGAACVAQLTGRTVFKPQDLRVLFWLVACGALCLYPFALGWTPFDSYALGYGSIEFVTALLLVTLAAWHFRRNVVVLIVIVAAIAYCIGAYESRNLWDYLIDPLVALYALVRLLAGARRRPSHDVAPT
jgi:hypothetical protein